jgi:transforming growth factor-beta-induced protein
MNRKLLLVLVALVAIFMVGVTPSFAQGSHPPPPPDHPTNTPTPAPVHPTNTPVPVHPTNTPTNTPVAATNTPVPTTAPTEPPPPPPPPTEPPVQPSIADIVVASATGNPPQFVTLLAAVQAADPGILAALADRSGQLTVFAPTDEAFAFTLGNLGVSAEQLLADRAKLTRILQYHVIPGVFTAGGLANIATLPNNRLGTLTNASLQFTNDGGLRVNNIPIINADIRAVNGIIHVISEVLIPPDASLPTIAEVVVNSSQATPPQFTVLLAAVQAADPSILAALADENGSLTVFAPTDAAFAQLLSDLNVSAEQLLGNRALLDEVLRYHVIAGELASGDLIWKAQNSPTTSTLQGDDVRFSLRDGNLFVNDSKVIIPDIFASNGIIHVIDRVLMPPQEKTIAQIVVDSAAGDPPQFTVLLAAVQAADPSILAALADENGNLTVFAPTDAAFGQLLSDLNVSAEQLLGNRALLDEVLRYHVLAGEQASGALIALAGSADPTATTLQGDDVTFSLRDGSLFVNESQVITADIQASNGIIHVIDAVLMPPQEKTIAQIVVDSAAGNPPQFTVLLAAVQAADPSILAALADEDGSLTVFAPTDAAFAQLLSDLNVSAEELLGNRALLTQVLQYHVLAGKFASGDLVMVAQSSHPSITTLLGEDVTFSLRDGSLFVNESQVVTADIMASNGIIHVIDAVLMPPQEKTIAQIVVDSAAGDPPQFTVLLAAVQAADPSILAALADENSTLTVFAPTDEAFAQLLSDLGVSAAELLANTELLNTVLRYHVLPNVYASGDLIFAAGSDQPFFNTLQGDPVNLSLRDGSLFINESGVVAADVMASNGIIHVINKVLLPPAPQTTPTPSPTPEEIPSIAEIVVASASGDPAQFTILLAAVQAADPGILAALADDSANLTVFAPTDAAFAALLEQLGVSAAELLGNTELLNRVLQYHVLPFRYGSGDLTWLANNGQPFVFSLIGERVGLSLRDGALLINDSGVVTADIQASNGIIHVIDAVLLPPTGMTIAQTVIDSASATPAQFTILLAAVQAADPAVLAALSDEDGKFTVFAPTDAAFAQLLSDLGVSAEELLGDTELLTTVLLYHVLPGEYAAGDLIFSAGSDQPFFNTLQGAAVDLTLQDGSLFINDSKVIAPNIATTNGIIHVINAVLLPPG